MRTINKLLCRTSIFQIVILSATISILFSVKAYADFSATLDVPVSFEQSDDEQSVDDLELVLPTYHPQQVSERERATLNTPARRYVARPVCHSLICNQNVTALDFPTLPIVETQEYLPLEEEMIEADFPDFDPPIRCQYLNQRAGMRTQPCY